MKIKKFKSLDELDILKNYDGASTNAFLNRDLYEENFDSLYYIKGEKNFYILIKRDGYYKMYYYINDLSENFDAQGTFVSEVVSKEKDAVLENLGFFLYKTRVRLRLMKKEAFFSKRVNFLDDRDFIYSSLQNFDKYSGERLTMDEVHDRIKNNLFVGIEDIGFIEYKSSAFQDSIEHFYILPKFRSQGYGSEILKHFIANVSKKKRLSVWTYEGSDALRLYKKLGFAEDGLKSYVYIGGNINEGKN